MPQCSFFFSEFILVSGSLIQDNIFGIRYEPSGVQLSYYYISFGIFYFLAMLSFIHTYYFELKKSLVRVILTLWGSNILLITIIENLWHFSYGNRVLYQGTTLLTGLAMLYVIYISLHQISQILTKQ